MSSMPPEHRDEFLGLPLHGPTTAQLLARVIAAAREQQALRVGYFNAAQVNLAFEQPEFAADLRALDVVYADGQAVVWAARWRGLNIPERVNAGDFTRELMQQAAVAGLRLALVGGRPGEADRAAERFRTWAPGLQIVYMHHGYFGEGEAAAVLAALEATAPDLVLLGMGAPRQEHWCRVWSGAGAAAQGRGEAAESRGRVWWCVGALFEYYAGTRARAPRWVRRAGLEWLVRLVLEPRRLWRRYVIGNPLFIWRVVRGRKVRRLP